MTTPESLDTLIALADDAGFERGQQEVANLRLLLKQVLDWDQNRDFIMPYRLRDPIRQAIAWKSY